MTPDIARVVRGPDRWAVACQDAADFLKSLPDSSVHMAMTSPPYYGLRSYLPGCVRPKRSLTPEQLAYVLAELDRLGVKPDSRTKG